MHSFAIEQHVCTTVHALPNIMCNSVCPTMTMIPTHSLVGHSLLDYLCRKSSVTETAVCGLMAQLLEALHYLHSHLILHLDVRVRPTTGAPVARPQRWLNQDFIISYDLLVEK